MTKDLAVERALEDEEAWSALVTSRLSPLREFLQWAAEQESGGRETSLRLENRDDLIRCAEVLPLFDEPWWGVVVYSCFDSVAGAEIAAQAFHKPVAPETAARAVERLAFPRRAVNHHRRQSTLKGAKRSLVSACERVHSIGAVLGAPGVSFDDRFTKLMALDISWWGRTTCFDALLRAGVLGVGAEPYRPEKAYLLAGVSGLWD